MYGPRPSIPSPPKTWMKQVNDELADSITFNPATDFFWKGEWTDESQVDDEDYDLSPSHVKKTVVQGILARVCLFRAGWPSNGGKPYYEKARDYALAVKTSDKHHLIQTEGNPVNI